MPDEMRSLLPGKRLTLSTKEKIEIKPVPFGKLPEFTESVATLFSKINATGLKIDTIQDWQVLFEVAAEETIQLMGFVIEKPRPWFNGIDIADGLEILDTIIEQNLNERAKKNLKALLARWSSLLPTQSKPLLPPDTPGAKSEDIPLSKSDVSTKVQ